MDERDQERQLLDAQAGGAGRLRGGVDMARAAIDRVRLAGADAAELLRDKLAAGSEDAAWILRERIAWPVEDGLADLGTRGAIGVFGGGGIALAGVVAALLVAGSGGSGSDPGTAAALAVRPTPAPVTAPAPAAKPRPKHKAAKPTGPTLHGAPPDFSPAKDVKAGVGDGKALGGNQKGSGAGAGQTKDGAAASASDAPAAIAKIGATPKATASAAAQASSLKAGARGGDAVGAEAVGAGAAAPSEGGAQGAAITGPPAPKAAKRVARRFAEAFVVYEVGGVDGKVRETFAATGTRQLTRSLLHRPPRQPADVKVPRAKVVNVVAGPSKGQVYEVSVSLLRVGVTSELRLELERGVGKRWEVTNVLG